MLSSITFVARDEGQGFYLLLEYDRAAKLRYCRLSSVTHQRPVILTCSGGVLCIAVGFMSYSGDLVRRRSSFLRLGLRPNCCWDFFSLIPQRTQYMGLS